MYVCARMARMYRKLRSLYEAKHLESLPVHLHHGRMLRRAIPYQSSRPTREGCDVEGKSSGTDERRSESLGKEEIHGKTAAIRCVCGAQNTKGREHT